MIEEGEEERERVLPETIPDRRREMVWLMRRGVE